MDMDIDLEDLIATDAANNAKASIKFQPKGKPKPKPKSKPNSQPESKSTPTPSTQLLEVVAAKEEPVENDANQIVGNVLDAGFTEPGLINNVNASTNLESIAEPESKPTPTPFTQLVEAAAAAIEEQVGIDVNQIVGNVLDGLQVSVEESEEESSQLDAGSTDHGLINNIDESTNVIVMFNDVTDSEPRVGKFKPKPKPKPKTRSRKLDEILNTPDENVGPVPVPTQTGTENKPKPKARRRKLVEILNTPDENVGPAPVPTQTSFTENELVPSFTPDEILGTSSIQITDSVHPTETISDYHVNEEPFDSAKISLVDSVNEAGRSSGRSRKPSTKALQSIVEAENDNDYVPESESLTQRKESQSKSKSKSKSKKSFDLNKKPARKRKKGREVLDEVVEVPKKKFSHSTRRNKRPVNPELLKIPEDEFELHMHNFPLKELIRLREHRERLEKKQAASLETQGEGQSDDHISNGSYYNYQTYMKITPRMKWTKQDTQQFYEAIKQFGTDLSIIKECFPGRTREQIRSKFKKEYKQHRLRMESALNTRVKGHSHYEFVIEQLKKARAEEDSEIDDSINLTGEGDEEAVAADVNEGGDVELGKEVKDMEPLAAAAESPTKSDDFEDDTWSHYKSEI